MEFFALAGAITFVVALAIFARNTACALVLLWILSSTPSINLRWFNRYSSYNDIQNAAVSVGFIVLIIAVILDIIRFGSKVDDGKTAELFDPTL